MIKKWSLFLISLLPLLFFAFYNGYPIFFPDSIDYLRSGINGTFSEAHPSPYALFLWFSTLGISLWFTIIFQGLITLYLLYEVVSIFELKNKRRLFLISIIAASFLTPLSFHVSRLMPDIFTSLMIVSYALLLFNSSNYSSSKRLLLSGLIIIFSSMHLSNALILILMTCSLPFFIQKNSVKNQKLFFMSLAIISFLVIPTTHLILHKEFKHSQSSYAYLNAKLIDNGRLEPFIRSKCQENINYSDYCKYLDQFPQNSGDLLWREITINSSDFYFANLMGRLSDTRGEFKKVFWDIALSPNLMHLHLLDSLSNFRDLFFKTEIRSSRVNKSSYLSIVSKFFREDASYFISSKQRRSKSGKFLNFINPIQFYTYIFSLFLIPLILWKKTFPRNHIKILLFIFVCILINALVMGTLGPSNASRFQSRVTWLFPFFLICSFFHYWEIKRKKV